MSSLEETVVVNSCKDCGEDIHCTSEVMLDQCGCTKDKIAEGARVEVKTESEDNDCAMNVIEDIHFDEKVYKKMIDATGETKKVAGKAVTRYALSGFFNEDKVELGIESMNKKSGDQIIFGYEMKAINKSSDVGDTFFEKCDKKILTPMKVQFEDGKEIVVVAFKFVFASSRILPIYVESNNDDKKLTIGRCKLSTHIATEYNSTGTFKRITNKFESSEKEEIQQLLISHFKINARSPEVGMYCLLLFTCIVYSLLICMHTYYVVGRFWVYDS